MDKKKPAKRAKKDRQQKQLELVVGTMIGLLVILIVIMIFTYFSNNFTYKGITFKKTKYGEIIIYSTNTQVLQSFVQ